MGKIIWDNSYSIGNEALDDQHRKLIEYYNKAHDHMLSRRDIDSLGINALIRMVEYCRYHFTFEEEYMEEIGFAGIQEHKNIHNAFYTDLNHRLQKLSQGEHILTSEILKLVENWIVYHILNEDQQMIN